MPEAGFGFWGGQTVIPYNFSKWAIGIKSEIAQSAISHFRDHTMNSIQYTVIFLINNSTCTSERYRIDSTI